LNRVFARPAVHGSTLATRWPLPPMPCAAYPTAGNDYEQGINPQKFAPLLLLQSRSQRPQGES
jgi:hypothetical protein